MEDQNLKEIIQKLEMINEHSFFIKVDEVKEDVLEFVDKITGETKKLYMSSKERNKEQTGVGTATVLKKCEHDYVTSPKYQRIQVGDKVQFAPGTTVGAYLRNNPEFYNKIKHIPKEEIFLYQFLHVENIIGVWR